jgi:hypothetical protein
MEQLGTGDRIDKTLLKYSVTWWGGGGGDVQNPDIVLILQLLSDSVNERQKSA